MKRMTDHKACSARLQLGFSLVELAIVMLIISILMAGVLVPLSIQMDVRKGGETRKTIEEAREALVGFAMANSRLPCPASAASNGVEAPSGGGVCTAPLAGFVPAVTLSLTPTDAQGYLLDGWNNRVRYAVTTANSAAFTFTTTGQMKALGIAALASDLRVCSTSTGKIVGPPPSCAANATLTSTAVAVIYSLGPNGPTGGTGTDEAENLNADRLFISHDPTPAGATNGEFDDLVVWLSPNVLYNRLITALVLP